MTKFEDLRPSLEPSHAFFVALKEAKKLSKDTVVVINSCGDAYKDREILEKNAKLRAALLLACSRFASTRYARARSRIAQLQDPSNVKKRNIPGTRFLPPSVC